MIICILILNSKLKLSKLLIDTCIYMQEACQNS